MAGSDDNPTPPLTHGFLLPMEVRRSPMDIAERVSVTSYGAMALDVAMGNHTIAEIAQIYGYDVPTFHTIRQTAAFVREYEEAKKLLQGKDKDAGFRTRARYMAESMLPEIQRMFLDKTTPAKERIAIFDKLVSYAKLDPSLDKAAGPGTQVNIIIDGNIRGVTDGSMKVVNG